ncbi:MAG: T9SS type A sorting domain-containing protein [Bacteroidota bacterium]
MSVSILFSQVVTLYVEYGTTTGVYPNSTSQITSVSGIPNVIEMQNLLPNTKYYYRTRYRTSGTGAFSIGPEHSFHTQRAVGSSFIFTVESDVHLYDKKGCENEYKITLANEALDQPDFMINMGDTYGDDHNPFTITSAQVDSLHKVYRPILGSICHSIPYFFCVGNHEGEKRYYFLQTPPNNLGVYETLARKKYFPNPYPNSFYSGDTLHESYGMGQPENYYAWTWGNALFVVMDVYRYDNDTSAKPTKWDWTIGLPQYTWLKNTLEGSTAQYKFVFAHHVSGEGRGGIVQGHLYEWGGYENNGTTFGFTAKRPGWAKPIHQLFVDNGVNIFFQGHDHLFAHEVMGGVTYQEVPMPSDSTYEIGMLANATAYTSDTVAGAGHLRVTVTPSCVNVDFVRAYLPIDTITGIHHNREVAFAYTVGSCTTTGIKEENKISDMEVYPNPATNNLNILLPDGIDELDHFQISLFNSFGQMVLQTTSMKMDLSALPNGLYFLNMKSEEGEFSKKVIINR